MPKSGRGGQVARETRGMSGTDDRGSNAQAKGNAEDVSLLPKGRVVHEPATSALMPIMIVFVLVIALFWIYVMVLVSGVCLPASVLGRAAAATLASCLRAASDSRTRAHDVCATAGLLSTGGCLRDEQHRMARRPDAHPTSHSCTNPCPSITAPG